MKLIGILKKLWKQRQMPRLAYWESWNISSWIGKKDLSKPRRPRSEVYVKNMWIFHRDFTEFSHRFSHIISQRCEVICEIIMWNTCETGSTFSRSISQAVQIVIGQSAQGCCDWPLPKIVRILTNFQPIERRGFVLFQVHQPIGRRGFIFRENEKMGKWKMGKTHYTAVLYHSI